MANGSITIYVGPEMEEELKRRAEIERRSVSQITSMLLEAQIKEDDQWKSEIMEKVRAIYRATVGGE